MFGQIHRSVVEVGQLAIVAIFLSAASPDKRFPRHRTYSKSVDAILDKSAIPCALSRSVTVASEPTFSVGSGQRIGARLEREIYNTHLLSDPSALRSARARACGEPGTAPTAIRCQIVAAYPRLQQKFHDHAGEGISSN